MKSFGSGTVSPGLRSTHFLDRYKQYFYKYLESSPLIHKTIQKITDLELEKECNRLVTSFSLSYKAWQNLKTILGGMYAYAVRKHYITCCGQAFL